MQTYRCTLYTQHADTDKQTYTQTCFCARQLTCGTPPPTPTHMNTRSGTDTETETGTDTKLREPITSIPIDDRSEG